MVFFISAMFIDGIAGITKSTETSAPVTGFPLASFTVTAKSLSPLTGGVGFVESVIVGAAGLDCTSDVRVAGWAEAVTLTATSIAVRKPKRSRVLPEC